MEIDDVIYGTLLGDSSLIRDRTTFRLDITYGDAQKDYLLWKGRKIGWSGSLVTSLSGYGAIRHSLRYYNKEVLAPVSEIVLVGGKKTITDQWLTKLSDFSLAVWYQDDGSWGKMGRRTISGDRGERYSYFHTSGFDSVSVRLLRDWLCSIGLEARVRLHKGKYEVLYLSQTSTSSLWDRIAPYLFLSSKVDSLPRPGLVSCRCGVLIPRRDELCLQCLKDDALAGRCGKKRLLNRFGTSSLKKIKMMRPAEAGNPYWFDTSRLGLMV